LPRLQEKTLSWALYHPANRNFLKNLIERVLEQSFEEVTPICRELPVLLEMKADYTIAGYATGWQVHFVDLVVLARSKKEDYLIAVEVKTRAGSNAAKQAMKYVAGLLTTIIPKAHNRRGDIFQFYAEQVFAYKKSLDILETIRKTRQKLNFAALLIAEKLSYGSMGQPIVRFTPGIKKLAKDHAVQLSDKALITLISNVDPLIAHLARKRAEEISTKYHGNEAILRAAKAALLKRKVIKFSSTEKGNAKLFLYPSGTIEINNGSKALRHVNGRYSPLKILNALEDGSGGRFYLQYFLNGTNNPVFFLEVKKNDFLGFQHREPNELHCNGIFNEYIATDAKPFTTKPEAGDVFCPAYGQYFVAPDRNLQGLARRITLIPDKVYPSRKDPPKSLHTLIISPRVKKARYNNLVRPYLTNSEAIKALNSCSNDVSFFYFNNTDVPFICNGIRVSM
jgi:hypothetical protein